jgi:hypothetical protein
LIRWKNPGEQEKRWTLSSLRRDGRSSVSRLKFKNQMNSPVENVIHPSSEFLQRQETQDLAPLPGRKRDKMMVSSLPVRVFVVIFTN